MLKTGLPSRAGSAGPVLLLCLLHLPLSGAAVHMSQPSLEGAAANLARMWSRESADLLSEVLVASGIRLRLANEDHLSLSRRQAVAVLRDYLGSHRTESIGLVQATEVGGSPLLGYAELRWDVVHEGASQAFQHNVFVGFVREDEAWRVFEVRVLQ